VDGSARPQRFGLMTIVAEKRNGTWLVAAVQNTNGPTDRSSTPEGEDIKSPIVVPRPKERNPSTCQEVGPVSLASNFCPRYLSRHVAADLGDVIRCTSSDQIGQFGAVS
jgi:hypothetical protein